MGKKQLFLSRDAGLTWTAVGPVPTSVAGDVLDHAVHAVENNQHWAIGTTVAGGIVRLGPR